MFIQIEKTFNENSLKFITQTVWINFIWECKNEYDANKSELSKNIWKIGGIVYLMFGRNFVLITKNSQESWDELQLVVLEIIDDFLKKHTNLFENAQEEKTENSNFSEFEQKIIEVLEKKVNPVVNSHGGMVKFIKFEDGIVYLDLMGACKGCKNSEFTLKNGIQNLLCYYFFEIKEVKSV